MEHIIEAIREEQVKLITEKKDIDIAKHYRMMDYLTNAIAQLRYYIRECGE